MLKGDYSFLQKTKVEKKPEDEKIEEKYVTKEELLDRASEASERADFLKGADIYLDDFTGIDMTRDFLFLHAGWLENLLNLCRWGGYFLLLKKTDRTEELKKAVQG